MLSSDEFSRTDKENLRHRILLIHRQGDHILVLTVTVGDLLALADPADVVDHIPVFLGFLKIHRLGFLHHFFVQVLDDILEISVEKIQRLPDLCLIFFFRHISLTGRLALMDMVIQARAVFSLIPRQFFAAHSYLIKFTDQFHRLLDRKSAGVRSEIFRLVLFHRPRDQDAWIIFLNGHLDKRIGFVIHQHRIVFRPVFFDQITFQHQRFQLGVCDNVFKVIDQ